ncbi:LysR family transcriptional regulator [Clostridium vitabionis]|uniref:LysR family transcriptional regulator n=1 Tax=Clostridium vitabionis TaxID=2784388 RepID=UPI001889EC08|nr:LysR family transcriptional regulator [Clostridium vitabionis]
MEYRNLVTFLRVAELGNFTKAAEQLGYAQSTVTFHIQSLENELGLVLFDRIGKKISLTDAGQALVSYANEIMKIQSEIDQLKASSHELNGRLRIGVTESMLTSFMVDVISKYNEQYPHVSLDITADTSPTILNLIRSSDLDIGLVMGRRIVDPDFKRVLIREARVSFIAPSSDPLAGKDMVSFTELAEGRLILPEKSSIYRRAVEEVAADYGCVLKPAIQVNNTAAIIRMVQAGKGISFLPEYAVHWEIENGTLQFLNIKVPAQPRFFIQVVYHSQKWITPQMQKFIDMLTPVLKKLPTK